MPAMRNRRRGLYRDRNARTLNGIWSQENWMCTAQQAYRGDPL